MKPISRNLVLFAVGLAVVATAMYTFYYIAGAKNASPSVDQKLTVVVGNSSSFHPIAPAAYPTEMSKNMDYSMVKFQYNRDATSVYYVSRGVVHDLPSADLPTFEVLTGSILEYAPSAIDKNHAYYLGTIIPGADPQTFRVLNGHSYSADDHTVFWQGRAIAGADPTTFVAETGATDYEATDKNNLYCGGFPYPLGSVCPPPGEAHMPNTN